MFEDRTYENILRECLESAPGDVDTRQGSIFFDAVAAACNKIAEYYADLRSVFDLVYITTSVGEYLDRKGSEFGVTRKPATAARYEYLWESTTQPEAGNRFFTDGLYFTLREDDSLLYLEAEIPGVIGNNILYGTSAIPVRNIQGLVSSAFGGLIEPGAEAENDENYRDRIIEKIAGPSENGNRQHYKTWSESVPGVGRARIIPLFAGPNTVMGVIIGADGRPASHTVIERVQDYIDPITQGLTAEFEGEIIPIGDGWGDGAANLGAHFAAVAPNQLDIDVCFSAELKQGYTEAQLKEDVSMAIAEFLKNLMLTAPERETVVIRMSAISSILYSRPGLVDYTNLTLNGGTENISLTDRQCAVLGEVTVNAVV